MPQSAEKVIDHEMLFRQPEYTDMFDKKKTEFEFKHPDEKISEINEWTKTPEYQTLNFQRQALTVNPAKACQPLGAVFAANGFKGTLPFVHGSQGCVAYYRSHFSRHFKEPTSCVSSSMTEDAAVFGGLNNMVDGLANSYNLYKPEMIAVLTTCMAEVIGDDLDAFIKTAKQKGSVPNEFDVPFAHTPAFVGRHITGYDNALQGRRLALLLDRGEGSTAGASRFERQDQLHRRLRRLRRRQHAGDSQDVRADGCRLHGAVRSVRRLEHADRRRVPHVRRRHHQGRGARCAARPGDHQLPGVSRAKRRSSTSRRRAGDRRPESPGRRHRNRQVPDGSLAPHRQADPEGADPGARPPGRRASPTRRPTCTARSSRSTATRISCWASPSFCSNSAPNR